MATENVEDLKRELLALLLEEEGAQAAVAPHEVSRAVRDGPLPASREQERFWFLSQLGGEDGIDASSIYLMSAGLRIDGPLDVEYLRRAFAGVIARHEALRTALVRVGEELCQVIEERVELPWQDFDMSSLTDAQYSCELAAAAERFASATMDFSQAPLLRIGLVRRSARSHVLLITQHHAISDGWSTELLFSEVSQLYRAFRRGEPDPLPPLAIQYADYTAWQCSPAQMLALAEQLSYWKNKLAGLPPLVTLPTDRPRPLMQNFAGAQCHVEISETLTRALQGLGQQQGATLFMTLAAGLSLLLGRYSGQNDVALGTPIANRTRREFESVIGCFVNTLVLRADLSGEPTFLELLQRIKQTCLEAYANQAAPFEQLVTALNPERSPAYSALIQTLFTLNNQVDLPADFEGLDVTPIGEEAKIAKFDLTLMLSESDGGLHGRFSYNTGLFDAATIERLREHFLMVLEAVAARPNQCIDLVPLTTEAERAALLARWGEVRHEHLSDRTVTELFESQAHLTPGHVAVRFEAQRFTYAEINARANQLARHLHGMGVRAESVVAVCAERSPDMVVALLAVLKAGGVYLPLDPSSPRDRLGYQLADATPHVLLTQQHLWTLLPEHSLPVFCIEDQGLELETYDSSDLGTAASPDNLAYIIYTSGSSGRPKGCLIEHRSLAVTLLAAKDVLGVTATDEMPSIASSAFDISLLEMLLPLVSGGSTRLLDRGRCKDLRYLIEQTRGVTFFHAVPTLVAAWLDQLGSAAAETYPALRCVMVGGEAVPAALLRSLSSRFPRADLVELYGPSEATLICSYFRVSEHENSRTNNCIGLRFSYVAAYVLDQKQNLQPVGVPGELHLGGFGLARGYLNNDALTAERFVPNRFRVGSLHEGEDRRMYRTGDLVRYLPDGTLEYLGRIDNQVKIRGFRIELGEIESVLRGLPGVDNAVVVAREDIPGNRRLVAYLVPSDAAMDATATLMPLLKGQLPDYMLPQVFVTLKALPLTSVGKVDRKALPAPEARAASGRVAARTPTERALIEAVASLLHLDTVGIGDHFFHLSGHSLLATQLISRISKQTGVNLPLKAVFERPVLEDLGALIDELLEQGAPSQSRIGALPRPAAVPASYAQERMWFHDQLERQLTSRTPAAYLIHAWWLIEGRLDAYCLRRAFAAVIARHESLRTSLVMTGDELHQVIGKHVDLPWAVFDLSSEVDYPSALRRSEQDFFGMDVDLARAPLLRVGLLRRSAEEHVLLLTQHHAISDGWSLAVLLEEVSRLYGAFAKGEPDPLLPPQLQYADFAIWQRSPSQVEALVQQIAYWKKQLAGLPPLLTLPTDRPRPMVQNFAGAERRIEIPSELTRALFAVGQSQGATLFMTLAATFAALLGRYANQTDIALGTPIANRTREELEGVVGCFVNTLVLRADLSGGPDFLTLLQRIKKTCLDAYEHQAVPFEQLVAVLNPERSTSHSPLFQAAISLNNVKDAALEIDGARVVALDRDDTSAKFDLSLVLFEHGGGVGGSLLYNIELFDASTVDRMARHFLNVLTVVSRQPSSSIAVLPLMDAAEQQRMLVQWNDTRADLAVHRCPWQLIEDFAHSTPEQIAVESARERLSYAELNARANRLARHLRELGVVAEMPVGVCMRRSADMVIAMLAIWKAGGVYLPLDSTYPAQRIAYQLGDAKPAALLTQSDLASTLPASGVPLLALDGDTGRWSRHSSENLDVIATPGDLSYIIYTSGSTGRPKGVLIEHRALQNLLLGQGAWFGIDARSRVLQIAAYGFDVSILETAGSLTAGATLVILTDQEAQPGPTLNEALRRHDITHAVLTPSVLAVTPSDNLPALRVLLTGTEVCALSVAERWCVGRRLINGYGPTEVTIGATSADFVSGSHIMPIGRPWPNNRIYVLDGEAQPVPVGVTGELHIGGAGVARGYLNRADLSAEKFVANPFVPNDRLYKTGDLVRWLADGQIEFLGRIDSQLKLRGFRVELGEIEARISEHRTVREAVVLLHETRPDDKQLVAYVTPHSEGTIDIGELRTSLRAQLPKYMVPESICVLETFPLNANGKIDRAALRHVAMTQPPGAVTRASNAIEERTEHCWRQVLPSFNGDVHSSFFDVGGDSLRAVSLVAALGRHFDAKISDIFRWPTVAAQARQLRRPRAEASCIEPLRASGHQKPLFVLHPAGGGLRSYHDLIPQIDADVPVYGVDCLSLDPDDPILESIEAASRHYLLALRSVQPNGPYRLLGYSSAGLLAYEMAWQLRSAGEVVEFVGLIDTYAPADISVPRPEEPAFFLGYLRYVWGKSADEIELARVPAESRLEWLADFCFDALNSDEQSRLMDEQRKAARDTARNLIRVSLTTYAAAISYRPKAMPGGFVLFTATEVTPFLAQETLTMGRYRGWDHVSPDTLHCVPVEGSHQSMISPPYVAAMCAVINAMLAREAAVTAGFPQQTSTSRRYAS